MIREILSLLSEKDKKSAVFVVCVIVFQALLEVAGAASVVPLLILLVNSGSVQNSHVLKSIETFVYGLGVSNNINFTVFLMSSLFILTVAIFFVRSYSSYQCISFVEKMRFSLSERLLKSYLSQRYEYFLTQNASDLSKNLLSEVDQIIGKALHNLVNMVAYAFVGAAILIFLFVVSPMIALVTLLAAGGVYALIYLSLSKNLAQMGQQRLIKNKERFIYAGEIFGGIKAIKLSGNEKYSAQKFLLPSHAFATLNGRREIINEIPAYFIEMIAIGGLIIFTYLNIISAHAPRPDQLVPLLGLYGYSFYKLKPALSSIFTGLSSLKYSAKTIEKIKKDLVIARPLDAALSKEQAIHLKHDIQLIDVHYNYRDAPDTPALSSIHLNIPSGTRLAIVGSTGSGKTTLTNLLLGLLEPSKGEIKLDGTPLNHSNIRNWQKNIGYVPQDIFMMDTTIAENIAFGIPKECIDMEALKKASRAAKIDTLIEHKLADGYNTVIGDKGVRLSGGERQRVGIARALYLSPDVLVFDEATSALDSVTEKEIIEEINKLSRSKTIVMVAHRLSTVKYCDVIVVLKNGQIEATGTYETLAKKQNSFSSMINTSS